MKSAIFMIFLFNMSVSHALTVEWDDTHGRSDAVYHPVSVQLCQPLPVQVGGGDDDVAVLLGVVHNLSEDGTLVAILHVRALGAYVVEIDETLSLHLVGVPVHLVHAVALNNLACQGEYDGRDHVHAKYGLSHPAIAAHEQPLALVVL